MATTWTAIGNGYAYADVSIASGGNITSEIDMIGYSLLRVEMPAAWDAANLTFQVGAVSGSLVDHYLDGMEYTKTSAAASRSVGFTPADSMLFQRYIKIRSGTAGTPVTQTAARTLRIVGVKIID